MSVSVPERMCVRGDWVYICVCCYSNLYSLGGVLSWSPRQQQWLTNDLVTWTTHAICLPNLQPSLFDSSTLFFPQIYFLIVIVVFFGIFKNLYIVSYVLLKWWHMPFDKRSITLVYLFSRCFKIFSKNRPMIISSLYKKVKSTDVCHPQNADT